MAKKEKFALINFFRILTPAEIAKMTKISTGVVKISLTRVMLEGEHILQTLRDDREKTRESESNILSFKERKANDQLAAEEAMAQVSGSDVVSTLGNNEVEIHQEEKKYDPGKDPELQFNKKDSTSLFIIKEKKKCQDGQLKLWRQNVMNEYKGMASVEFHKAAEEDEDTIEDVNQGGVLVNKKQL